MKPVRVFIDKTWETGNTERGVGRKGERETEREEREGERGDNREREGGRGGELGEREAHA